MQMKESNNSTKTKGYTLPDNLRGRSISVKVIPTVCNLKNMLEKLVEVNGDYSQLKNWEKRSFKAYQTEEIKDEILSSNQSEWKDIIRKHILSKRPSELGPSAIDIYLVAYVSETIGAGKEVFIKYIKDTGISKKEGSANAIWQIGRGDGVYLGILNEDGIVMDWDFIVKWVEGK